MPRLLALDFDGVIADSAPEAFVVALRTYAALHPETALRADLAELCANGRAPSRERIAAARRYAGFLELMPLGNRAEDYGVLLAALEAGASLPDQAAYDVFRDGRDRDELRAFHRRFYRERTALSGADPEGWRALMGPYPGICALLRRHAGRVELAIATAKDRRSVRALLRGYGIDDLFGADRVLDKETGVSKRVHLEHLRRTSGFDYPVMTFVDDKVNHLEAVASLGVRCVLAGWGYNGLREAAIAREHGYGVASLADAEAQLFGSGGPA